MRPTPCALGASLLLAALSAGVQAQDAQWHSAPLPLPAGLSGPAQHSGEIVLANPLLEKIAKQLWELPWAPGEAVVVGAKPDSSVAAFGFWNGPEQYILIANPGTAQRRLLTPGRDEPATEDRLAYFGHEVTEQPVAWTGPARLLVIGQAGPEALEVSRVPLFEAGCTLMVLERGERELRQAREALGHMQPPPEDTVQAVTDCQARIDTAREKLRADTRGLVETYAALPEPRYTLEDMAWISRHYKRGQSFEKLGEPDLWERVFYGRPEFAPCIEARKAAQEALFAQRPKTLAPEAQRVFGEDAAFAASITHGLTKFRREQAFPEALRTEYSLSLAREEYEPFQVVIAALGQPVKQAQVTAQWEGDGPHPEIEMQPVGYVETKPDPDNFAEYVGWWPDPLMPPGPVDLAPNQTQPIWGRVYAPKGTPPGKHVAVLTVQAEGQAPLTLRLTARVLDFDLGFTHLPSLLSLRLDSIKRFYSLESVPQEVKRRWYEFCLRYRMNPNNI